MLALTYILVILMNFNNCISFSLSEPNNELLRNQLTWPTKYYLKGESIDIISGFKETFEIWYSATLNRSRIDYYDGVNKKYYYGQTENEPGIAYEIHTITTKEFSNLWVCLEFEYNMEAKDFLSPTEKFIFKGTKTVSSRTLQIWIWSETLQFSRKYETQVSTYFKDGVHIPVQIISKVLNLDRGSVDKHLETNYYGYESEFNMLDLELDTELYDCKSGDNYGKSLKKNLKHPGVNADPDFAFQRFKVHHKKEYKGDEHETRKQIFYRNWKFITEHNKKNLGYKMEVNEFADRTEDELKFLSGTRPSKRAADPKLYSDSFKLAQSVDELPAELDLRLEGVIGPVRNQGVCGACWAFSTTAAVEGALARRNGGRDLDLSEQSLVDCAWAFEDNGCRAGSLEGSMKYVLEHGIPTEYEYGPYLMEEGTCGISNISRVYKINGFGRVTPRNINALKAALIKYGPVVASVYASKRMKFYSSGIFYEVYREGEKLNHGVTVVGYGVQNGDTYWIVKNSWGESWGEDGYILISAKNNNCLLLDVAYYPIV